MNVRLVHVHYDFEMTGKVRDLFSIDCRFQPIIPDGASEAEVKACARELVEVYMDKLDLVFRELVKGKREPLLQDYANQVTVGYRFEGHGRKLPLAILARRARAVFACQAVHDVVRREIWIPQYQATSIACRADRRATHTHAPTNRQLDAVAL